MVWFNGQYLRLPENEKGLPELARETMRRFYRVAVPPEEEVDAFKALVEFYTAGPAEADRPGSSRTEELALDYVTDGPAIVAAFQQAYGIDLSPGKAALVAVQGPHVQPARGDPAGEDHRLPDG